MIAAGMVYALVISLLLTLAALAAERLLGLSRRPRRFVWLLMIVASALLPCINIIVAARTPPPSRVTELSNTEPSTRQAIRAYELIKLPLSHSAHRLWPVLPYWDFPLGALWALSSAAMLLGMIGTSLQFRRISNRWPVVQVNGRSIMLAERTGPALFGVLRPQVILPRWLLDASPVIRSIVIAHEESHLAARDPLLLRVAQLIVALAPWNLPAWWQLRRLRFAIEVDCDARVLQTNVDPVSYGETLLAIAQHRSRVPHGAVALTEPISQLERRIQVMLSKTPRYYAVPATTFAVLATAFVACATQLQVPVATSTAKSESVRQDSGPDVSGGNASPKPNPGGGRVTIDADELNCSSDGKTCAWSGHVKIILKELVVLADKGNTNPADSGSVLVLRGTPATFIRTPSSGAAVVRGAAERIVLDGAAGEVRLTGHASLTQGDARTVTGEQLTYKFP
jgi:lipopolysaccharide transport protein LptA